MTQYYSRIDTTLNGDVYNIPFSYMKESEISVYINDEPITAWEFLNESQIKINEIPSEIPADAIVSIRRTTDITKKVVDYTNQSMLKKENLNLSQNQLLNAVQEIYDNNVQFEIDTENNILQNRTEIDAKIEANNQKLLDIQSSFESKVNTTIAQNKADTDKQIADFEQEVNTTIVTVKEAASKINQLEQSVTTATTAAQTATNKADETQEVLSNAVTEMDSKLNIANIAVENAMQQANIATQKAQEILDINPANTNLSNLTEEGIQVIKDKSGSGLEICDIGMALYVDETKGLRRYLNGQIVDINTNTQAFLDRLKQIQATNPDYFTDEETWQTEATLNTDGCVYKFVLNYSGETVVSVRLPKYPNYVEINSGGTLPVVGNGLSLGLTDGTNNFGIYKYVGANGGPTTLNPVVAGYNSSVGSVIPITAVTADKKVLGVTSDSEKSGLIATLNQTKLKLRYFIQIATGSETENNIINEIELNNPFSLFDSKYSDHELNNLSWLKSSGQWNAKAVYPTAYDKLLKVYNGTETVVGLSVKLSTETYTDYDFVLNTAEETFRLPLKNHTADDSIEGLTLYFYIGETVQNANLIDAGRIGEQLANKQDKCVHIIDTYINGTSGYRIWSDGYCEQWGLSSQVKYRTVTTVNLLKTFVNTNYNVSCNVRALEVEDYGSVGASAQPYTTSSIQIYHNKYGKYRDCDWKACGYLAEGEY